VLTVLIVSLGVLGRMSALETAAIALVWSSPEMALVPLAVAVAMVMRVKRRSTQANLLARWLRAAASEMRAGHSLRGTLISTVAAFPELGIDEVSRLAEAGRPLPEISRVLAEREGLEALGAVVAVAGNTGGSIVTVLEALAAEAADEASVRSEKRSMTAAARWSIGLVGGFPLIVLLTQAVRGELGEMVRAGPISATIVVIGVSLLLLGLFVVGVLLRRVRT
jgi:Flp pilus assembly protein TadB